ncbi:MAG: phosphatidate cytidylyltransferase [Armatimonadetes bacterium]|nr:phosphatidate cytidylyltransferase [Armatimonadota bacterium]
MLIRTASGLIGIAVFLALDFAGSVPFGVFAAIVSLISCLELWIAFQRSKEYSVQPSLPLVLLGPIAVLLATLNCQSSTVFNLLAAIGLLTVIFETVSAKRLTARSLMIDRIGTGLLIGGYTACYSAFVILRNVDILSANGAWIMLFVAATVWITDTFAYFFGRAFGAHPLATHLSPKKTVEGAVAGLIGAVIFGVFAGKWIGLGWGLSAMIGLIAGVVGQIGDLFESALKRNLGLKDISKLIPGHGGILDRFDSLLLTAPATVILLRLLHY